MGIKVTKKIICDRCGKEFIEITNQKTDYSCTKVILANYDSRENAFILRDEILCKKCAEILKKCIDNSIGWSDDIGDCSKIEDTNRPKAPIEKNRGLDSFCDVLAEIETEYLINGAVTFQELSNFYKTHGELYSTIFGAKK